LNGFYKIGGNLMNDIYITMNGVKKRLKQEKFGFITRRITMFLVGLYNPITGGWHLHLKVKHKELTLIYINLQNLNRNNERKVSHYNGDNIANTINHEMIHHVLTKHIDSITSRKFDALAYKAIKDMKFREWASEYGLI